MTSGPSRASSRPAEPLDLSDRHVNQEQVPRLLSVLNMPDQAKKPPLLAFSPSEWETLTRVFPSSRSAKLWGYRVPTKAIPMHGAIGEVCRSARALVEHHQADPFWQSDPDLKTLAQMVRHLRPVRCLSPEVATSTSYCLVTSGSTACSAVSLPSSPEGGLHRKRKAEDSYSVPEACKISTVSVEIESSSAN